MKNNEIKTTWEVKTFTEDGQINLIQTFDSLYEAMAFCIVENLPEHYTFIQQVGTNNTWKKTQ